ncbi:MAG: hypothetical protein II661_09635, partial [Bacteroidales bacterium]|nr:hypothetical protein [Bacteroidales bacterium]
METDWKKKYEEALNRFNTFKEKYCTETFQLGDVLYDKTGEMQKDFDMIFPELRESEDERIRAFLYDFIKVCAWSEKQFPPREKCLAYLEKQKEQKPDIEICPHTTTGKSYSETGYPIEQESEWSEEDEAFLKVAIAICNRYSHKDIANWLKSLKNRGNFPKSNTNSPSWKPNASQLMALDGVKRRMSLEGYGLCPDLQSL